MRIIDYDKNEKNTGGSETHVAVDESIEKKFGNERAYEVGFSASDGVRAGTMETDGRVKHPEKGDDTIPKRTPEAIENENPGLADN